ncbi:MAG: tetratricopeptide repeat protein [Planctomycetota bacterium]
MQVAVEIRRRFDSAHLECVAFLMPTHDPLALLHGLADLAVEPLPRVYRLACGFLVRLDASTVGTLTGSIRLGEIAEGVLAPIDAEITPALLADEVRGLTGGKCVVCLPEGFFGFDLSAPLELTAVLGSDKIRRRAWKPLPEPPQRAERITEFILDLPQDDAEDVLNQGGEGIGEEQAGPDESGAGKTMLGKLEFAAGKALGQFGRALGSKGMQKAGGDLVSKGVNNDPKRLEGLLGKQEAALRDLLRRFREGKVDEALRRALPVGGDSGRGSKAAGSANLPFHNLMYSLGNILGGSGGGASKWFTEPDVYGALVAEYRKAAEQAKRDGDYRRAAFIYGKLLSDYRTAASLLQQGGLHRDAAALYMQKLNDPLSAARAYEAGGDVDDAVRLYRKIGQHVPAGDLLRKAGDETGALDEYRTAGRLLADRGEYKQAGELMMAKASEPTEALAFFNEGWRARPHPNAVPCAVHMAVVYADTADAESLLTLTNEADRFFAPPGNEARAAQYYNMIATLARREAMREQRAELHDRALVGLANKLRQNPRTTTSFAGQAWPNTFVSDVQFALRAEAKRRPAPKGPSDDKLVSSVQIGRGVVTAACYAAKADVLFVALAGGEVYRFSPTKGVQQVRGPGGRLLGLGCDPQGKFVCVLESTPEDAEAADLSCYVQRSDGQYFRGRGNERFTGGVELAGVGDVGGTSVVALFETGRGVVAFRQGEGFDPYVEYAAPTTPWAGRLIRTNVTSMLVLGDRTAHWLGAVNAMRTVTEWQSAATHWRMQGLVKGAELAVFEGTPGNLEFAGRNEQGSLYWSGLKAGTFGLRCESRIVAARGDYLCAAITRPGQVVGVTAQGINWFRKEGEGFVLKTTTKLSTPDAIGCFHSYESGELMVLTSTGRVSLVSVP